MKRLWAGVALLAVLLLGGMLAARQLRLMHRESGEQMRQAAAAALTGDWELALTLQAQAEARWRQSRRLTAALVDHAPMETIDGLFAQLKAYGGAEDPGAFAACCAELGERLLALGESHRAAPENIL